MVFNLAVTDRNLYVTFSDTTVAGIVTPYTLAGD